MNDALTRGYSRSWLRLFLNDAIGSVRAKTHSRAQTARLNFEKLEDRVALSFTPLEASSASTHSNAPTARDAEILVGFEGDVVAVHEQHGAARALQAAGAVVAPLGLSNGEAILAAPAVAGHGARLVTHWNLPGGADVAQVVQQLAGLPGVAYAEPNGVMSIQSFAGDLSNPGDPSFTNPSGWPFGYQEHLRQDGGVTRHIAAETAWDSTRGVGVVVAVVDTGVDLDHPDLNANILRNASGTIIGASCISGGGACSTSGAVAAAHPGASGGVNAQAKPGGGGGGGGGGSPLPGRDDNGHGTHVAGIIAAEINNLAGSELAAQAGGNLAWTGGTVGVAPQARLMPVKVLNSNGSGAWADIAAGIAFAASNGADIINMSLGGGFSQAVSDAIAAAYAQGVLVISAAGNGDAEGAIFPAADPYSLSIAAVDSDDLRASFSNYGFGVDVAAPGDEILSTFIDMDGVGPTESGSWTGAYGRLSGTSMATPAAAGVAALIRSLHPEWSPEQVAAQLLVTADNIDADNPIYVGKLGAGRINAAAAVGPQVTVPVVIAASVAGAGGSTLSHLEVGDWIGVQFSHTMDPMSVLDAANYELVYLGPDGAVGGGDDQSIPLSMLSASYDAFPGRGIQLRVEGQAPDGNYQIRVAGVSASNGTLLDGDRDGIPGGEFGSQTFSVSRVFHSYSPGPMLDDFDDGSLTEYKESNGGTATSISGVAAHDGPYGLRDADSVETTSEGWLYRNDAAARTARGDVLSVWIRSEGPVTGNAVFGFGLTTKGKEFLNTMLSIGMSASHLFLKLDDFSRSRWKMLASVPQTFQPDHWYRLVVDWRTNGDIIGRVYDSDGSLLLNTVTANDQTITGGGIAFYAIGSTKHVDTAQKLGPVTTLSVASQAIASATLAPPPPSSLVAMIVTPSTSAPTQPLPSSASRKDVILAAEKPDVRTAPSDAYVRLEAARVAALDAWSDTGTGDDCGSFPRIGALGLVLDSQLISTRCT